MTLATIDPTTFNTKIFEIFDRAWFLLTAGDFASGKFNCMTISWGSMGTLWNKPVVQVVVRPSRHTFGFIESGADFTLCAFPAEYRSALALLGSKSGRDGDKIKEAGLTPRASALVASPAYAQANLVIECRKIYADAFKSENFLDPSIEENYPDKSYHHLYIGEVLAIGGKAA